MTFFSSQLFYTNHQGGDSVKQVVYIDVLIFLNTIITFLLLSAASKLMKLTPSAGRFVIGSIVGGLSSLIIFAPDLGLFLSLTIKLLFSVIITSVTYNPTNIKNILRQTAYFFAVSFIFAGMMMFASSLDGISIINYNNGAVYINFSFLSLILASVICYITTVLLNKFTRHKTENDILYNIKIKSDDHCVSCSSILDTGNGLKDPFTGESIIIADIETLKDVLPNDIKLYYLNKGEYCKKLRLVPCSTINNESLLPVFRADVAIISDNNKIIKIDNPMIAVTTQKLSHIILPPDIKSKERSYQSEKTKAYKH